MWCGSCYTPHPLDHFHVFTPKDESGFEWRRNPEDALRYRMARDGDHLVTPFQCHLCHFRAITGRVPDDKNLQDSRLMCCLIRANLDAFWGRETGTVEGNRRHLDQLIKLWAEVGMAPTGLPSLGPYPRKDVFGMHVAVAMLLKSAKPGKYDKNYTQFETMRKLRAAFSNLYHASVESSMTSLTLGRDTAKSYLTTCPTQSMWFERFAKGCLKRMGQEVRQDLAVSIHLMLAFQDLIESQWAAATEPSRIDIAFIGAFVLIAFAGSFRGHEVFLVDTFGLLKYAAEERWERGVKFVIIPLLGKYKTEDAERYHLTPLAATTSSGLQVELWTHRLAWAKRKQGLSHGPAFSDAAGQPLSSRWLEVEILDRFYSIQTAKPHIIPPDVQVYEEYGISRSFRRGSTTEARNKRVDEADIDLMNRWRNFENAKGKKPRMRMQDHYSDIAQSVPSLLRYSQAL